MWDWERLPLRSPKTLAPALGFKTGVPSSPIPARQDRVCCSWAKETRVVTREAKQLSGNVSQSLGFPPSPPDPASCC